VYELDGTKVGNQATISGSNKYVLRSLTVGGVYLIKISCDSSGGTFQILFNKASTAPIKLPPDATELTADVWTDSKFTTGDPQWFKFAATAETQYIHAGFITLDGLYVQLYDKDGYQVLKESTKLPTFSNYKYLSQAVTVGDDYYIKATLSSPSSGGIYQIGFTDSATAPSKMTLPFSRATGLTADIWTDGNIAASTDEQWFTFTATAELQQYIHVISVTLVGIDIQVYDSDGEPVGSQGNFQPVSTSRYINRPVTVGEDYYIRIWPFNNLKGTYQIGFTNSYRAPTQIKLPFPDAVQLTDDILAGGDTAASDSQWFKFTATAETQYIHAVFGGTLTLDPVAWIYVQLYDSTGNQVDPQYYSSTSYTKLYARNKFTDRPLTVGEEYYIKAWPYGELYSSYGGTYQITFNTMPILSTTVIIPLASVNTWVTGDIPGTGEAQWFKFTPTDPTSTYIHVDFDFGTLNSSSNYGVYVTLYDTGGGISEYRYHLSDTSRFFPDATGSHPLELKAGKDYYILVEPYNDNCGTYNIAFSTFPITLPDATLLAVNTWVDGDLPTNKDVQWFTFTATAAKQYIHINFITLGGIYIQMYKSDGYQHGNQRLISSTTIESTSNIDQAVTSGEVYYIKAWTTSNYRLGTYKIAFADSATAPVLP